MKTRTLVYKVVLALPILAGLAWGDQALSDKPLTGQRFVIRNNSGCEVPGGYVQVINSSGTVTLFEQPYGNIRNGGQHTIVAPTRYAGTVLNRNTYMQNLCDGSTTTEKGPVVITYTTLTPCPVPPQNILRPCTVVKE